MSNKHDNTLRSGRHEESCMHWEAALVDLQDGTLALKEEEAFRTHAETCKGCGTLLRESGHGREWVRMLHTTPPAVPGELFGKILARTETLPAPSTLATPVPVGQGVLLPHSAFIFGGQRAASILLTTAMAFFSIALTLSVTGFRLNDIPATLHASGSIPMAASRQFFDTKKQVVSFYDNLLLVHEVEATVQGFIGFAKPGSNSGSQGEHLQPSARRTSATVSLLVSQELPAPTQAKKRTI